jgi:hypothetical protein
VGAQEVVEREAGRLLRRLGYVGPATRRAS